MGTGRKGIVKVMAIGKNIFSILRQEDLASGQLLLAVKKSLADGCPIVPRLGLGKG
jgi:hypothetical protein